MWRLAFFAGEAPRATARALSACANRPVGPPAAGCGSGSDGCFGAWPLPSGSPLVAVAAWSAPGRRWPNFRLPSAPLPQRHPLASHSSAARKVEAEPGSALAQLASGVPADWVQMLRQLERYVAEHGHARVPLPQGEGSRENYRLARWVNTQRVNRKRGQLSAAQEAALEGLGLEWDVFEAEWRRQYARLVAVRDAAGPGGLSLAALRASMPDLYNWVVYQRVRQRKGKQRQEFVALLEDIQFQWSPQDAMWVAAFEEYKAASPEMRRRASTGEDGRCGREGKGEAEDGGGGGDGRLADVLGRLEVVWRTRKPLCPCRRLGAGWRAG